MNTPRSRKNLTLRVFRLGKLKQLGAVSLELRAGAINKQQRNLSCDQAWLRLRLPNLLLLVVAKVSAVVGRSLANAALRNGPPKLSARLIVK